MIHSSLNSEHAYDLVNHPSTIYSTGWQMLPLISHRRTHNRQWLRGQRPRVHHRTLSLCHLYNVLLLARHRRLYPPTSQTSVVRPHLSEGITHPVPFLTLACPWSVGQTLGIRRTAILHLMLCMVVHFRRLLQTAVAHLKELARSTVPMKVGLHPNVVSCHGTTVTVVTPLLLQLMITVSRPRVDFLLVGDHLIKVLTIHLMTTMATTCAQGAGSLVGLEAARGRVLGVILEEARGRIPGAIPEAGMVLKITRVASDLNQTFMNVGAEGVEVAEGVEAAEIVEVVEEAREVTEVGVISVEVETISSHMPTIGKISESVIREGGRAVCISQEMRGGTIAAAEVVNLMKGIVVVAYTSELTRISTGTASLSAQRIHQDFLQRMSMTRAMKLYCCSECKKRLGTNDWKKF